MKMNTSTFSDNGNITNDVFRLNLTHEEFGLNQTPEILQFNESRTYYFPNFYTVNMRNVKNEWAGVIGAVLCFLGVSGVVMNILSLIIWSSREMRSTTGLYMIALSVFDSVVLILNTVFHGGEWLYFGLTKNYDWLLKLTVPYSHVYAPIFHLATTASVYTTLAISIDRAIGRWDVSVVDLNN